MRRFTITIAANDAAQEGYALHTAAKILTELQAMGTECRLIPASAPWQIAMEGQTERPDFISEHVCDLMDVRKGRINIQTA